MGKSRTKTAHPGPRADITGAEVLVSVAADDNARHQRLVDVLNALSVHGLRNVALP